MLIQVNNTPNPDALKFIVPTRWLEFIWECSNLETAKKSNLAKQLWEIEGVVYLMFGSDFVLVTKKPDALWELIQVEVVDKLSAFLEEDVSLFYDPNFEKTEKEKKTKKQKDFSQLEEKIIKVLDEKVQPALESHGGMVEFVSFENGVLTLDMQGACKGCPSSMYTLKNGIENLMKYYFPEINELKSI